MPVTATIDGNSVDITRGSLSIENIIEERSVASFSVEDIPGSADYVRGMPVSISDPGATEIFAGFIDTPGRARRGAVSSVLQHDIVCMDNHYLADKRLVVKVYTNQTLEFIVEDILTDYLAAEGITEGEIQTGPIIASVIFNYVRAPDAFDALKELSGFIWYIDKDLKLYFIDRTTNLASWNLDSVTYRPIKGSVYLSTGTPLYRNRQFVRGGTGVTASQVETEDGDGSQVAFNVGYPISSAPTVTVGGAGQTVGIKGVDTGKDCYWSQGDSTVTFSVAPGNGVEVIITYIGQYPLIVRADDPAEVAARLAVEGVGTGIVENIVTEAQWDSSDGMRGSAKAKIVEFARDAEKFIYQTTDGGLAPGQIQEITYSPFSFSAKEMLIESVSVSAHGDVVIYDISCITGPLMGSWSKFFSGLLLRGDKQIRIGDSLLLVLFVQLETLALVEATDLHSDAFPPDVSRWIAEPPAQGAGHHVRHEALALAEATAIASHATEDYDWDDADMLWDFFTWG